MEAFMEVFKYALKFSDMSFENIWLAHETLTKRRFQMMAVLKHA